MGHQFKSVDHVNIGILFRRLTDERTDTFKRAGCGRTIIIFPPKRQNDKDRFGRIKPIQIPEKIHNIVFDQITGVTTPVVCTIRDSDEIRIDRIRCIQQGRPKFFAANGFIV